MENPVTTIKHIVRRLMRSPMFTVVTLVTIALAVGANSAIFSVINGILLKPLPYQEPNRLLSVGQTAPGIGIPDLTLAPSDYFTFKEESRTFASFGMWQGSSSSVTGVSTPEQVRTIEMTEGTLNALGVQPLAGRWFTPHDDAPGSPATVVLTYGYWQRKFGGDRSVIGRQIRVDGQPREIIGVMPQSFQFLDEKPELLLPDQFDRSKITLGNFSYQGVARLKPGVTIQQASADVARMIPMVVTRFAPPPGFSVKLFEQAKIGPNLRPLKNDVIGDLGKLLWVLMGSIGAVLLIACANVANLLLVRTDGRRQELAVRAAIGASGKQLGTELLMESAFLGLVGGAAGLGLAYWALRLLVKIGPGHLPRLTNISIDPLVLLFTLLISLAASLLFGLIPVLRYASPNVMPALRAGGRTLSQSKEAHRTRNTLVVLQTALAVVLLISSGLMIRTFQALRHVTPGFRDAETIQTVRVYIPEAQVKEPARVLGMFHDMQDKIKAVPGVVTVALGNSVPTDGNESTDLLYARDHTYAEGQLPPLRRFKFIAPGYFEALGTRLVAGRDITWTDVNDKRPTVIISENMAREMWKDPRAAIGKQLREGMQDDWREIVGVVEDVRADGPDKKAPTVVYWPMLMDRFWGSGTMIQRGATFAIRTPRAGSESLLKEVREAIWSVNPELPLARVRTMEELYSNSMARSSFTLVMLAIAGGMALLLGIVGIYGVISYSVAQRTREIGIRIALGAQRAELKTMVVRHGLLLAGIGVAIGLLTAVGATRFLSSLLFNISPLDPLTYIAVAAGLLLAASAASYVPAHKASGVNPVDALRAE